jgi:hypothetical protein
MKSLAYATVVTAALLSITSCNSPSSSTTATTASAAPESVALSPDEQMIRSAESAAPAAIGAGAAVVTIDADGKMRQLRAGTNGFTCMPDSPETPGPDPMCGDANAMAWGEAWMTHKAPPKGKVGFMYMLAGGTDASNTDPFAKTATDANHWIKTGPHVMVVGAASMMQGYPRSADPDTSKPYVMWPDTPYEHLMLPVE